MSRFFERGTALAEMEQQMMMAPNFAPRGYGSAALCRYRPTAADVDCRNCLEHRRRGCRSLTCLYKSPVVALETVSGSGAEGCLCLPMPDRQIQRMIERAGLENQSVPLRIEMDELPEKVAEALDPESLSLDDISALNRMCRAIEPLKDADREKLNAIVLTAEPGDITAVCYWAENLDRFDFVPDIHTPRGIRQIHDPEIREICVWRRSG